MCSRTCVSVILVASISGCLAAGSKDLVLRRRIGVDQPGTVVRETVYYWSDTRRVADDPRFRTIFDRSAKTVTVVDKSNRTYYVRTFDDLLRMRETLRKRFESLSLDDRKSWGLDERVTLTPTGQSEKIAGYEANEYQIDGGPIGGTVWIAEGIKTGTEWPDWEKIEATVGSAGYAGRQLAEAINQLGGFPVRTSMKFTVAGRPESAVAEVVEVRKMSLPPEMLAIPDRFEKVPAPPLPR